jgi:hypothetical protein
MNKIVALKVTKNHEIWLQFQDGESKTIDFRPLIGVGISSSLLDPSYFNRVSIDNGGGIEWPNGFDFCPNFLRDYHASGATSGHVKA